MACVIAAPCSGSGKTLLSLTLAAWARSKGLSLQPFKVGPDYLDAQQLSAVSGKQCRNLDLLLSSGNWVKESFHAYGSIADLTLIEGVMGLFDGIGPSQKGSTAHIARHLGLPIVFVVDAGGQSGSLAALIKGFNDHDPEIRIAGVVLNKINTIRHKEILKDVLNSINIKLLGCLPKDPFLKLPTRHLGLAPTHEVTNMNDRVSAWRRIAEENLDLVSFEKLLCAPKRNSINPISNFINYKYEESDLKVKPVAIAEDQAFFFRYPEIKDCLQALNMPIIPWKPLNDEPIPKKAKGLLIPGGFPEQYAKELSQSKRSILSLQKFAKRSPVYAECGGMLLLGQTLTDLNGQPYEMAGLLPFQAEKGSLNVGYRKIECTKDGMVLRKNETLMGHEFHRWELKQNRERSLLKTNSLWRIEGWRIKTREEGWGNSCLHASWIHLHWASCPMIVHRWRNALDNKISR